MNNHSQGNIRIEMIKAVSMIGVNNTYSCVQLNMIKQCFMRYIKQILKLTSNFDMVEKPMFAIPRCLKKK